ncbi:hypothetical protein HS088_TW15G00962 [Tripterygium wilfordii]|uniref:Uncharacterized protein n=1 Tax=Tripterygium wilfordii TaxID=458696 RepID=A0A7J7CNG6_TRIWF|nr:hypothetical protein HS088_TW15G00962 [Tripterygium wilfordii]
MKVTNPGQGNRMNLQQAKASTELIMEVMVFQNANPANVRLWSFLYMPEWDGVFSAVSFWYGFVIGRESSRKELGDLVEDLRRRNSASSPPS